MGWRLHKLNCRSPATLAAALGVIFALAEPVSAQPEQVDRWIRELGDDSFTVRKAAADNLLSAGPAAREPLRAVVEGPDPELRAAARRILSLIEASDFRRRLDAFANDVDGKAGLTLPGWEIYRKQVGGDAKARALFVEMQRHEAPLLAAMFGERLAPRDTAWEERLMQLVQWQNNSAGQQLSPPLASCAAMLLVGAAPKLEVSDRAVLLLASLVGRSPLVEAMQNGTHRDALRRLVAAWVVHCQNNSDASLRSRVNIAGVNSLAEAVPLAVTVAVGEADFRQASANTRMAALLVVGQLGKHEHVDPLERLLDDSTVCYSTAVVNQGRAVPGNVDVQIRDVALLVLLRLTNQSPSEYGYGGAQARIEQTFNPMQLAPPSLQHRMTAIDKWRKWRSSTTGRNIE